MTDNLKDAIKKMYNARERAEKEQQTFEAQAFIHQAIGNYLQQENKKASEDLEDLLKRI